MASDSSRNIAFIFEKGNLENKIFEAIRNNDNLWHNVSIDFMNYLESSHYQDYFITKWKSSTLGQGDMFSSLSLLAQKSEVYMDSFLNLVKSEIISLFNSQFSFFKSNYEITLIKEKTFQQFIDFFGFSQADFIAYKNLLLDKIGLYIDTKFVNLKNPKIEKTKTCFSYLTDAYFSTLTSLDEIKSKLSPQRKDFQLEYNSMMDDLVKSKQKLIAYEQIVPKAIVSRVSELLSDVSEVHLQLDQEIAINRYLIDGMRQVLVNYCASNGMTEEHFQQLSNEELLERVDMELKCAQYKFDRLKEVNPALVQQLLYESFEGGHNIGIAMKSGNDVNVDPVYRSLILGGMINGDGEKDVQFNKTALISVENGKIPYTFKLAVDAKLGDKQLRFVLSPQFMNKFTYLLQNYVGHD